MTRGLLILLSLAVWARAAAADPEVHVLPVADRAPNERLPLLLYLHGLGGSGSEALTSPQIRALAQRHRMVLVAPDGNLDREGRRFWNAGGACCNFDGKAVNDVARLEELIYHWTQRPEIDPARVYVVGFSNGGFMAHRLACYMDDRLAAIVSIGGAGRAPEEACAPVSKIAVLEIHGDADPVVRYGGGHVLDNRAADPHPSAPETFHDWAERLGCLRPGKAETKPRTTAVDLDPRLPGAETKIESYADCPLGSVELWTVRGGGHQVATPAMLARVGEFLVSHPKLPKLHAPNKNKAKKRKR